MPYRGAALACLLVAALLAQGCADPAGPADLLVSFVVGPTSVAAGDSLEAVVTFRNPTRDTVTIDYGGCMIAHLTVLREGTEVNMQLGPHLICTDIPRHRHVLPRDSVREVHYVLALLQASEFPFPYVVPPPPGSYTVRAEMLPPLPVIEREFTVVP